jgi:hypothetical protein
MDILTMLFITARFGQASNAIRNRWSLRLESHKSGTSVKPVDGFGLTGVIIRGISCRMEIGGLRRWGLFGNFPACAPADYAHGK